MQRQLNNTPNARSPVEDELFVVLSGQIMLTSGERCIVLNPSEFVLIAKDVEYKVVACDKVRILFDTPPDESGGFLVHRANLSEPIA
jgi:mannose-6-phosphate isomerase-like protein (cupin superfamily)